MPEIIKIQVNDREYAFWSSISISRSIETLAGAFSFTSMDRWYLNNEQWEILPGSECKIYAGDDILINGFVDTVSASLSADRHILTVTGRDRTGDLVDCSTDPTGYKNINLFSLAVQASNPFAIDVTSEVLNDPVFALIDVQSGESVFDLLARHAKERSVLLLSDFEGGLLLTNSGSRSSTDGLQLGRNVKACDVTYNDMDRFSEYTVKGQSKSAGDAWTKQTLTAEGVATDDGIDRYRPRIIQGQGAQTINDCQQSARWEANIRAAKAINADVTVQGFRQSDGTLWQINSLVDVQIDPLRLGDTMLISSIEYTQSVDGGTLARLSLTRPDAYQANPTQTVQNVRNIGDNWS